MSKRVYEIARDLNLSTKEVVERLNAAGVEVKSHFALVEESLYERVFGEGSEGAAPNGRSEAKDAQGLQSRMPSQWERSRLARWGVYVAAAILVFALAAGVGAMGALMLRGDLDFPAREEPPPPEEHQNVPRSQEKETAAQPEEAGGQENAHRSQAKESAGQQSEAEYVARVGEIQERSVETFLDSHNQLMHYDALTADDVEKLQLNQAALKEFADQVDSLDAPQKYREQYEVFRSAINELYEASTLAYKLAADPIAATQSEFDEYDRHVNQAAAYLKKSNEMLGRDYKTIEGAHTDKDSPL